MTIKTCVEKAQESNPTLEEKVIHKAYVKFYVSMLLILATVLLWTLAVVSVVSSRLMLFLELVLSVIFVVTVESLLKASIESETSFSRLVKFSKLVILWGILLVASIVAVVFLKANFLL